MRSIKELLFGKSRSKELQIKKAKQIIEKSPTGHFSLKYRVQLLQQIWKPDIVSKLFFESAKKVSHEGDFAEYELLKTAHAFLYLQQGDKRDFEPMADKYRNYFVSMDGTDGFAGLSAVMLAYHIAYSNGVQSDFEDYNGKDDDNAVDWENWEADFYASMAYSGGNPFVEAGDIDKRKEFWGWYLETAHTLCQMPDKPILALNEVLVPEDIKTFERTQTFKTESISEKLNTVANMLIEDLILQEGDIDWEKIEIDACCIRTGIGSKVYFYSGGNRNQIRDNLRYPEKDFIEFIDEIKEEMYAQNPKEGAWIMCNISINRDKSYMVKFNHDNLTEFPKWAWARNPDNMAREFEDCPRSKEFTPEWLRAIVKSKKLKYFE
jgi:hypothetical protein